MDVNSEINRLTIAKQDIVSAITDKGVVIPEGATIDAFGELIRDISAIIDVTELPTDNINENVTYRIVTRIEDPPLNVWIVTPDGISSARSVAGPSSEINIYYVSELPSDMGYTDGQTIFNVYVLESTGICYVNIPDMGVVTLGFVIAQQAGLDKGWIEDINSIDYTNPANMGVYTTKPVYKDFARLYNYKNSEWEEKTVSIEYEGATRVMSGEYVASTIDVELNSTNRTYSLDAVQHILNNKTIPIINVNVSIPDIGKFIQRYITTVTKDFFIITRGGNQADGYTSRIGEYAFAGCAFLTTVELPDEINSIGEGAFYRCYNLNLAKLPVLITEIPNKAFEGCAHLTLTELPSGVTRIGQSAFNACDGLQITKMPHGVRIENDAFGSCDGLTSIELSGDVYIDYNAFNYCENLTTVTFRDTTTQTITTSAFVGCGNLTTINVPWSEGEIANAPWGAYNATINYNYTGE